MAKMTDWDREGKAGEWVGKGDGRRVNGEEME